MTAQHVRYSFLVRNPSLTRDEFRRHYRERHGPLALAQPGFVKYTIEYVQNHRQERLSGSLLDLDGISATTQRPRPDLSIGFFDEPDYAHVQPDELYLFDLPRVNSMLALREPARGSGGSHKGFALVRDGALETLRARVRPARTRAARLDLSTVSRLGFGVSTFDFDGAVEFWTNEPLSPFDSADERIQAWSVDELVMMPLDAAED